MTGGLKTLLAIAFLALGIGAYGCGESSDGGSSTEPGSVQVGVRLTPHGVIVDPDRVGFKPGEDRIVNKYTLDPGNSKLVVVFKISNEYDQPSALEVHEGPFVNDDENSAPVPAHDTGTMKTDLATGHYQLTASAGGPNAENGELEVGSERPSS